MFFRRKAGERSAPDAGGALAQEVHRLLALGADATVRVYELNCGHGLCGGAETVVLVMREGTPTEAFKIAGPMSTVTAQVLEEALRRLA